MTDREGVDADWRASSEEREGVGRGETLFRLYCMNKEYMFNKKEKGKLS